MLFRISISLLRTEFVVLVGPSGYLEIYYAAYDCQILEDISAGELYIDELGIDVAPKDRDIAMVFKAIHCIQI